MVRYPERPKWKVCPTRVFRLGLFDWVRPARCKSVRLGLTIHAMPPTSDGHNFFVRTPFWVFLNSVESPFSQYYSHVPVEDNRCDTPIPGVPLTTRQPVEFMWISGYLIPHGCVPFIGIHISTKKKKSGRVSFVREALPSIQPI